MDAYEGILAEYRVAVQFGWDVGGMWREYGWNMMEYGRNMDRIWNMHGISWSMAHGGIRMEYDRAECGGNMDGI